MLNLSNHRHQALAAAVMRLKTYEIQADVVERLLPLLDRLEDRQLYHFNPRLLATHLQIPEKEMLDLLVAGVREGIFTLNWEIECPACKGVDSRSNHLSDLRTHHTCPVCHHTHLTDIDDQVRITFSIDERLRTLSADADDQRFRAQVDRHYGVVSGHRMLTLQKFRDLFPRETLPPAESLVVRRVAILFTDLAGSTALYTRHGDTRAFDLVRQHFRVLFQIVDTHNGVVVKTIGDAIMGAFTEPVDAVQAAIAMHHQLALLNQQLALPVADHLILKVGIDAGPCIAVNLDDRSDYFGTTVNIAARVQATSTGNSIAVTDALVKDTAVVAALNGYTWQHRDVVLKGIDTPVVVHSLFPFEII